MLMRGIGKLFFWVGEAGAKLRRMKDSPPITIRPAADADMDAIAAIYAHHVRHGLASFETEPPDPAEMRRRRADVLAKSLPYLVAIDGNAVLGYAYAGTYRPRAAYANTVENSVYLRPDAIGRGIGQHLLAVLVEACEARGLRQMIAVVGDSANVASIRLHEKLGFRRAGVLTNVGYKHGRWLDSVLLQRSLGAGAGAPPER
jgi:L-amino acid N-acyltransferase YncA